MASNAARVSTIGRCDTHPEETLTFKCLNHNQLCCAVCKRDHERCNKVDIQDDHCLTQIRSLRSEFDAIFDRLEQRAISEMECIKTSFDTKIQTDVNRIEDFKEKLQKLNNAFKDGDVTTLDNFFCDGEEKPLPGPDHVFVVEKYYLRNIKKLDGMAKCNISGICRLTSGEFILLYNRISKLKLLNSSFSVMSTSDVPNFPWDICSIGQREAAVALDDVGGSRSEILLVRVRAGEIEQFNTIPFQHLCIGIAYHDDHFYVTSRTSLYKYDKKGRQGRVLYNDPNGANTVNRCAVNPDGTRIFITNYTNHQLITLNRDGTKIATLIHPELKYPAAVHVSPMSHVFVCCFDLHTVVQVGNNEGVQSVTTLAGQDGRLSRPWALYFDSSKHTLVVGLADDRIAELKLK